MNEHTLKQLKRNEPTVQKAVYYEHADRLMTIVLRYVTSLPEAEDLLQDIFIIIFKKIETYDKNKGSFDAWSARIAINQALMFLRKKTNTIFYEEDLHSQQVTTTNKALLSLENQDIQKIIQELDEKYAIIFKLKAIEGYKHKEIAELLNIKKESSRTIFSRAKRQLRQLIKFRKHYFFTSNERL